MSPVSESRWSVVQPLHFVCVSDSRPSLSTTQPSWSPTQIRQRGRPPASCCHSFSGVLEIIIIRGFFSFQRKTRRPGNKRKQVVWFHYHLSTGRGGGGGWSVQIWCSLNPHAADRLTLSVPGRHNNSGWIWYMQHNIQSLARTPCPFNIHVGRVGAENKSRWSF